MDSRYDVATYGSNHQDQTPQNRLNRDYNAVFETTDKRCAAGTNQEMDSTDENLVFLPCNVYRFLCGGRWSRYFLCKSNDFSAVLHFISLIYH